jgi:hypothetical protein
MGWLSGLWSPPCPGWTRRWGITWNCKLSFGHKGNHRNGNRTWKPGE